MAVIVSVSGAMCLGVLLLLSLTNSQSYLDKLGQCLLQERRVTLRSVTPGRRVWHRGLWHRQICLTWSQEQETWTRVGKSASHPAHCRLTGGSRVVLLPADRSSVLLQELSGHISDGHSMGQKWLVLTQVTSFRLKCVCHQGRDLPLVLREKQKANPIFISARKQSYVCQTNRLI